jgi:hypothetical protein
MPVEIGPLAAALVFSAIFRIGSDIMLPESLRRHKRRLLSFGAGGAIYMALLIILS